MSWYRRYSTLYPHVIAEETQRNADNSTSQPQQGLPSVTTPRVSTQNQPRYGGDTTSGDYPPVLYRHPNNAGQGSLQLDQRIAQRDPASNAARPQLSGNVYSHSSYPSANNSGLSDTSITNPWPITHIQEFQYEFHGTHGEGLSLDNYERVPRDDAGLFSGGASCSLPHTDHGIPQHAIQSAAVFPSGSVPSTNSYNYENSSASFVHYVPESPQDDITPHQGAIVTVHEHPAYPVNGHSESRTDARKECQWDDDNGLCSKSVIVRKDDITSHLKSDHFKLSIQGKILVQCQWMGCGEWMRRDTIFRHIREVHFELKRCPSGGDAMSPQL